MYWWDSGNHIPFFCGMFSPSLNFLDLPMNYVVWQFILQFFILGRSSNTKVWLWSWCQNVIIEAIMKASCSQNVPSNRKQLREIVFSTLWPFRLLFRKVLPAFEFSEVLGTHFHSFGAHSQERGRQPMEQRWIMLKTDSSCKCSMKAKHLTLPPVLEQEPMLA